MAIELNKDQLLAVQHREGAAILESSPGVGKTIVICKRYKYLLEEAKVDPSKIWIIADRFLKLEEDKDLPDPKSVTLGVFCKILLLEARIFNENKLEIYTISKQKTMISNIIYKNDFFVLDEQEKYIFSFINYIKTKISITKDEAKKIFDDNFLEHLNVKKSRNKIDFETVWEIFVQYEEQNNDHSLDWNSTFKKTLQSMQNESVQQWIKNNVEHILIDEFQNTTEIQLEIIKQIYKYCPNIFLFGDSFQSIKNFAGGVQNIFEKFEKYLDNKCIKYQLNYNYRLPKKITAAVNKMFDTNIISASSYEGFATIKRLNHIQEEEEYIIGEVQHLTGGEKHTELTFAVLCRTNKDVLSMYSRMNSKDTNIELTTFQQNLDTCDEFNLVLTFLYIWSFETTNPLCKSFNYDFYKFWADREEEHDLTSKNFEELNAYAKKSEQFKLEFFQNIPSTVNFNDNDQNSALNFYSLIQKIKSIETTKDIWDLVSKIWDAANLKTFTNKYAKLSRNTKQIIFQGLNTYLKKIQLSQKQDIFNIINNSWKKNKKKTSYNFQTKTKRRTSIRCCTMHNSQGEQYDYVFITGMTEGNMPISFAIWPEEKPEKILEEKQLFYVSATRATKGLYLLVSPRNSEANNKISRFLLPLEKNE